MKPFSVSSISLYNECPAKYALRYLHGYSVEDKYRDSRDRGSCVHEGLNAALKAAQRTADTDELIHAAQEASRSYAKENDVIEAVANESDDVLAYYIPLLGIGSTMTPYLYKGDPLLEFEFKADLVKYGVALQGRLDAVVNWNDQIVLVDWKVRSDSTKFYTEEQASMDKQLYVYAAILKYLYKIQVDRIIQVQISAKLPGRLRIKKNCTPDSVESFDSRLAYTTIDVLQSCMSGYSDSLKESLVLNFFDKVRPDSHFLRLTEIPINRMDQMMHNTALTAKLISEDSDFLPIMNAYICKSCPVIKECQEVYFK